MKLPHKPAAPYTFSLTAKPILPARLCPQLLVLALAILVLLLKDLGLFRVEFFLLLFFYQIIYLIQFIE